ncbi:broad-complex core protein isoform X1 [Sergentomyia squamirostris]
MREHSLLRTAEKLKIRCLCEEVTESSSGGDGHSPEGSSLEGNNIPPTGVKRTKNNQKLIEQRLSSVGGSSTELNSRKRLSSGGEIENGAVVVLEPRQVLARDQKTMTSLGMGMGINGGLMGVSMGYLDFAPEPPAPAATPVTEHVDLNCAPSTDTRDLSNSTPNGEVRIKLETLRSMDPTETIEMENHHIHTIHQLEHHQHHQSNQQQQQQHHQQQQQHVQQSQSPQPQPTHHQPSTQQQIQQPQTPQPRINQNNHAQSPVPQQQQQQQPQCLTPQPSTPQPQRHHSASPSDSHISDQVDIKPTLHPIVSASTSMDVDQGTMEHESMHGIIVTPEIVTMMTPSQMGKDYMYNSDASEDSKMLSNGSPSNSNSGTPQYTNLTPQHENRTPGGPKTWTQEDMEAALDALRNHNMSLTKASVTFGIPSTTLWQRAHRLGIDTPKKEGPTKSWSEDSLNNALEALRTGTISANKASKAFGIPSSTLYKIARREGIRLAAPFNAAPTTWTPEDLERALEAIRAGHASVQKASTEFGIPTGTLYGRCKREGIELSRSNPTPWSEDAMMEALEAVKVGHMSINQAAIHFNLPYSSLYGRFKRGKYDTSSDGGQMDHSPENTQHHQQQQQQQQQIQYTTTVMQPQGPPQQQQPQQHPVHILHHGPPQMVTVVTTQPPPPSTPHPQSVPTSHLPPTPSQPPQNHPNSHVYHHHSQQHHHMERS